MNKYKFFFFFITLFLKFIYFQFFYTNVSIFIAYKVFNKIFLYKNYIYKKCQHQN